MALQINTNMGALMASAAASSVNKSMETSMERLSTGKRINTASDDAAGVAIASRLTSEIRGTNQAIRNAADGQAMIDTAEGAHEEIVNILQRMRELAVQSANDTNDTTDRANLQTEFSALTTEIDRIAGATSWAGQALLDGSGGTSGTFNFQVGGNTDTVDTISITIGSMTSTALGAGTSTSATESTAGVTAVTAVTGVAEIQTYAVGASNPSQAIGDITTLTVGGDAIAYTAVGATETLSTIAAGLEAAKPAGAAYSISASGTDLLVTYSSTGAQTNGTMTLASDDGSFTSVTGTVTTEGVTAVTAVTGVAEISQVDATGYTVTEGKTYTLNVDGVELSYTAADGDDYDDLITGFQADADYDATSFTVSQSAGTISITQASTGAVSPTITFDDGLFDISDRNNATAAIDLMDTAIATVNTQRAAIGAVSNRLDSTISNLTNISTNLEAGRSRIQDADFAAESTNLAKSQILQQASTAMLAQANASKQGVLSLLQG